MRTSVSLTCQADRCLSIGRYRLADVEVCLYTHGVCTVIFCCQTCGSRCEYAIPDRLALHLDRVGVCTTVVRTPDEVLEWPEPGTPKLTEQDVGLIERSTLTHFNDCARREL